MATPKKPLYKVYNQRIAGWLMMQGFVLVGLEDEDEMRRSFVFCDTPQLHSAMKCRHEQILKNINVPKIIYK